MAFNLKNRSYLKLLDFTPREIRYLLDLSRADITTKRPEKRRGPVTR